MLEVQLGSNGWVKTAAEKLWAFMADNRKKAHVLNTVKTPGKYLSVASSWHFLSSTSY